MKKKNIALILAALMAATAATGCGGGSGARVAKEVTVAKEGYPVVDEVITINAVGYGEPGGGGEEVRGRFDDCPTGAVALPRSRAGSWLSLDRPSGRGGSTSSSSPSLEKMSSPPSPSPSDSHSPWSSPLSPPLASPSSVDPCAPLGVEYILVVA